MIRVAESREPLVDGLDVSLADPLGGLFLFALLSSLVHLVFVLVVVVVVVRLLFLGDVAVRVDSSVALHLLAASGLEELDLVVAFFLIFGDEVFRNDLLPALVVVGVLDVDRRLNVLGHFVGLELGDVELGQQRVGFRFVGVCVFRFSPSENLIQIDVVLSIGRAIVRIVGIGSRTTIPFFLVTAAAAAAALAGVAVPDGRFLSVFVEELLCAELEDFGQVLGAVARALLLAFLHLEAARGVHLLDDQMVQDHLLLGPFKDFFLDGVLGDEAVDVDVLLLPNTMCACHGLQVVLRVPVAVEYDDRVGGGEVDPEAARAGRKKEAEVL
mmetsp:Transcript_19101/g.34157  ORF Transcript_19101/g.34157 Transcript_19101/m.34157 type:complete len:327 (-) Transcript_19101:913-1893(-)